MDNNKLQQIKELFQSNGDPMSLVPSDMKFIFEGNKDYKQLFYSLAKQRGINPQEVLDFLNSKGE